MSASSGSADRMPFNRLPWQSPSLTVSAALRGRRRLVTLVGEVDHATRDVVIGACVVDDAHDVSVDLQGVTFMDCSGYGALVAARCSLQGRGGSLLWEHPTGQPARLLSLLHDLERATARSR